jgi:hypothetical protein
MAAVLACGDGVVLSREPGRVVDDVARALEQEGWYSGN